MQRIGKYEVVQLIGTGGFGSVYEARDPVIKRRVAIKTCTSDNEETRRLFHREAEIASHLEHRNIVEVFEAGFEGKVPYLAQEYLPGEDLDHVIERRAPLNLQHKLDILLQILRGLAHAHAAGVLHRDLEPGNVRLLDDGRVKLVDFGIARLMKTESASAKSGMTVGAAAYLAPEQLRGEPVDQRADLYSWGLVAYELLTYERPFTGTQLPDLESNILHRAPPPLTHHWRDCPPALERLVLCCLEKDRERRFAAAAEVIAALERQLGADPEATRIVLPAAPTAATPLPQPVVPAETARAEEEGALSTQEMAALEALGEAPAPAAAGSPDDTQAAPALGETLGSGTSPVFVEPPALPPPAPAAAPSPPARRRRLGLWLGLAASALLLLIVITAAGGILLWRALSGGPRRPAAEVPAPAAAAPEPAPAPSPPPPRPAELSLPGSPIPGLTVALNQGLPLPLTGPVRFELPAGAHTLRFSAPGYGPREVLVEVGDGERRLLELPALERAPAPPPPRRAQRRPAAAPPPPAAAPAPPPAPSPPRPVERGDLVEAGPGVVPPRSVKVPSPRPVSGRNLPAEVLVTVEVLVDEEGRAVELRVQDDSDAPAPFAKAALEAAQRSTFRPATKNGVPVKMWTTLRFRFRPR